MGKYLDAKLASPPSNAPGSPAEIRSYSDAVAYGLQQHQGVKSLARSYPRGNWETPAGYYYQAVDIASNRTSPISTAVSLLATGDTYARAEVERLGIGKAPIDPTSAFQPPPAPVPVPKTAATAAEANVPGWTGKGTPDSPLRKTDPDVVEADRPSGGGLAKAGLVGAGLYVAWKWLKRKGRR